MQKDVATVACDLTEPGAAAAVLRATPPDRCSTWPVPRWSGRRGRCEPMSCGRTSKPPTSCARDLRQHPVPCLVVSSAEIYGVVPESEQPIREDRLAAPLSPYALSKASQELYVQYYARAEALPLVIVRAFNHVGPRQGLGFVWSDLARQIAEIERGRAPATLEVGTTTTRRDFTDVRDMVRAYWLLLGRAQPGSVYNAASGRTVSIQEIIAGFLTCVTRPIDVHQVAQRIRPVDIPLLLGDASRLRVLTGWTPRSCSGRASRTC